MRPQATQNNQYDLAIVGGGMVGASLARAIALSHGSRLILEAIGVWPIKQQRGGIRTLHDLLLALESSCRCEAVICSMFTPAHLQANVSAWKSLG